MSSIAKNSFYTFLFQILGSGLILLNNIAISRGLGPEGRGSFALIMLVITVATTLSVMGQHYAFSHFAGSKKRTLKELFAASIWVTLWTGFIVLLGFEIFIQLNPEAIERLQASTLYIKILFPLFSFQMFINMILIGSNQILKSNIVTLIAGCTGIITLFLFLVDSISINLVLSVIVAMYSISCLAGAFFLRKEISFSFDFSLLKEILRYGFPMGLSGFFYIGTNKSDLLLINHFGTLEDVGIYAISAMIANFLVYIPTAISTSSVNTYTSNDINIAFPVVLRLIKKSLLLCCLFAALLAGTMWFVIPIVFGEEFSKAYLYLLLLLPSAIISKQSWVMGNFMIFHIGRIKVLIATASQFVLFVVLGFLGIRLWGIEGMILSMVVSSSIFLSIYFVLIKQKISSFNITSVFIRHNDIKALFASIKNLVFNLG